MFCFFLSLFLFAGVSIVNAGDAEKLVGANDAYPGQFPYTVSLRMENQHVCGGSIISPYHILTAAHCVKALQDYLDSVTVVSGSILLDNGGEFHTVANMWSHPEYNGQTNINHDIGVIKLADPINYNSYQKAISLPSARPPANSDAVISAWGETSTNGNLSNIMQYLYLNIIDLSECKMYRNLDVGNSAICTFDGAGIGLCSGDSGSPLVYKDQVVGVVSRGVPCARGEPDVFTSVYDTLSFVQEAMDY